MHRTRGLAVLVALPAALLLFAPPGSADAAPQTLRHTVALDATDLDAAISLAGRDVDGMATAAPATHIAWVELPEGQRLTGVEVVGVETVATDPGNRVLAGAPATPWVTLGQQGSLRGRRIAGLLVHPLRYEPATGRTLAATRLELELTLTDDPSARSLERHRIDPVTERRFVGALAGLDGGLAGAAAASLLRAGSGPAGDGPFQPTFRPSLDGSPVAYVLITSEMLAEHFEPYVEWKNKKGVQAVIRTVEWIDATYPEGIDRAERIRFFIRDAYQNWGTLFVTLGGDTDVIPPRYIETEVPERESIPCDMYYGCLEGNWNLDGDDRIGEGANPANPWPADDADLFFEVSIGRIPVSTVQDARTTVDKLIVYETEAPEQPPYPASLVALAERLFPQVHGADLAEEAIAYLPPWFHVVRLFEESSSYPGSIELTRQAAIDSIEAGFGMVLHVGHGYRNTMSVASGTINNQDVNALQNGPRYSVVFAVNCSSTSIEFNAIGERWLKNPVGGAVGYLGTSRLAFTGPSETYTNAWFDLAFVDSVTSFGLCSDMARASLAIQAGYDGNTRWNLTAITVLGDPELDIYHAPIVPLDVTHAASFELGQESLAVDVASGGEPLAGAAVTLWKTGESFASDSTDASGHVEIPFRPETAGDASLTVHHTRYRAYDVTLPVVAGAAPYPHVQSITIDDDSNGASSGDGDGVADAGETIELVVTLTNSGGSGASTVNAVLAADDPEGALTLIGDTVSYGAIASGGASSGSGSFVIEIDAGAPVAYQPVLALAITATEGAWSDVVLLPIHRPYIEHAEHVVDDDLPRGNGNGLVEGGEEIWYTVSLANRGQQDLAAVSGLLRALDLEQAPHPLVSVGDSTASFGPIPAGGSAAGDRFEFTLDPAVDPAELLLELTITAPPYADVVWLVDVVVPGTADSIRTFGTPSTITLHWQPPRDPDLAGYDIVRADDPFGPYTRINDHPILGSSIFEDRDLPELTRFYYQIVARDSSANAGPPSTIVSGTTNPSLLTSWPKEVGQQSPSSPTIVDLDGDWEMEVLAGAEMQYAWHCSGYEVVDGDNDPRTSGPFAAGGFNATRGFSATQAVGDMDGDGFMEVANVGFSVDSLYVWNHQGQVIPGFPKWVMDDFNWASPVMADVDQDGDLEILVWAGQGGRLFGWHHDGTEIVDGDANPATDGVLYRVFGTSYNFGSPAVADLDGDPELEIVFTINLSDTDQGRVYAVNPDATIVPHFPFLTGEPGAPSAVSSSPAVGDLDHDGFAEVVFAAERGGGSVYVLEHDADPATGWPVGAAALTVDARLPSPVLADLDGDTYLDVIFPATDGQLYAWRRDGTVLPGFPVTFATTSSQATQSTPTIADLDGDGWLEILVGDETGKLHAFNHDGTAVAGFPIQTGGEVRGSAAVWDCDRDNQVEVAVMSYDGNLYIWDLPFDFDPARAEWPLFRHDTRNLGDVSAEVPPVGLDDPAAGVPGVVGTAVLHPAVPNPFNPRTVIPFEVPGERGATRRVQLKIYDAQGRLVRQLVEGPVEAGSHRVAWDGLSRQGRGAGSGVYFVELRVGNDTATSKLVLLR
ncbi:MAG: C25 family cysteine peptidase [Candidatus Eiseniibacteriota bacterium]|jgi:hypothetical protein